ncbi:hypothetical protein Cme02nite_48100 [Catellatospora methionotrophica]|uniref:cellulase n=1 Tax=Catellatospora methionotrophica TaxID=121620 RepID=A0A8J3L8S1_9ACTN|nr:hypothetical protein Cme02nite_48100 [Catellatospora methionotrophica]
MMRGTRRRPGGWRLGAAALAVATAAALVTAVASAAEAAEAHMDNPFAGATTYVNPDYATLIDGSIAQTPDATLKAKMQTVKSYPTAVWLDRIAAIHGGAANAGRKSLADHLNLAVAQKGTGPITATFVVYDLPGRDCAALASNGELPLTAAGLARYKTEYIDAIAAEFAKPAYANVRIIAVIEPDGLPNLVTNVASDPECQAAKTSGLQVQAVQYALNKLHAISNVYTYMDIAHSGWLGWDNNLTGVVQLYTQTVQGTTAGLASVDGFVTNVSNYTPTAEPFLTDPSLNVGGQPIKSGTYYEWNPQFDESDFTAALYTAFTGAGWPAGIGMVVDTSRNGWGGAGRPTAVSTSTNLNTYVTESKVDRRVHRGLWCNTSGAGLGAPPQSAPGGFAASHLDAYIWVKPPGESDGSSSTIPNDEGKLADPMCNPDFNAPAGGGNKTGALPNAPLAGHWFHDQFAMLVANANPAVPTAPVNDTQAPSVPGGLTVTGTTASSVALAWTASTDNIGVTGYDVYRGTTKVGTATGTTYSDTGLTASTAYSYTVRARDAAGNTSAASASVTGTTTAGGGDTSAPTVPANLRAGAVTTSSITLAWDASTDNVGVTGYDVYRGTTKANANPVVGTSYTDTGLTASTAYSYTVRARDAAGNVSAASAAFSATTSGTGGGTGKDWLHTVGNKIVDESGNEVWLTGVNWFGFNATEKVFHGLWSGNITSITRSMSQRGINIVRVPISTQLLLEWKNGQAAVPSGVNTFANPELVGKTTLQVWDYWLGLCEQYGIKVMIDVHSAEADNSGHIYPVWWKGSVTSEQFYQAWEWVADRYKNNDTVVAMDVKNEPHGKHNESPRAKWDNSTDQDNFKNACQVAGNRILAKNPNVLILCEGIEIFPKNGTNWSSTVEGDYHFNWWGGNLRGVANYPVNLGVNQDQLVYSPHDYGPLVYNQPWFDKPFDKASLTTDVWDPNWLYIHKQNKAPLLIGEWGGRLGMDARQDKWMLALRDTIVEHRLHQTFWCLNPNSGDTGGLLLDDWATWDEAKYAMLKPALWSSGGKFVSLDHQVKLGGTGSTTGISLTDLYGGTTDTQAPSVPGGLTVTGTTSSTVSLSWTASTDNVAVTGYDVYRGTAKVNANPVVGTTYTDAGLTASTAYTYTVRARDAAGNVSAASASATGTTTGGGGDTQAPSVPGGLTVTGTTQTSVSLSWTASTDDVGVTGYDVYRGSTKVNANPVTATAYTDAGLTPATAYSYSVRARDAAGNVSAASSSVSATTQPSTPAGGLKVQYRNGGGNASDGEIRPVVQVLNTGTSAVALNTVKVRYYFTRDGSAPISVYCDWAVVGCGNLTATVVSMASPKNGADAYLEIAFTGGSLAAGGGTGDIQVRMNKNDWSAFNENNDYSYGTGSSFADAPKITAHVGSSLAWGVIPS